MEIPKFNFKSLISKKKEFNVNEYFDKVDKLTYQIDSYFIKDPIKLFDSIEELEYLINLDSIDMDISILNMLEKEDT